jgi:thiol-disulfide isomerase/thioredoxin
MKKMIMIAAGLLGLQHLSAQRTVDPRLAALRNEKDTVVLQQQLVILGSSQREEDLALLVQYYNAAKRAGRADSVYNLAIQRFPTGNFAYIAAQNKITLAKEPAAKEQLLADLKKQFPGKEAALAAGYVYYDLAYAHALKGNATKAVAYLSQLQNAGFKGEAYMLVSEALLKAGKADTAALLIQQAIANVKQPVITEPLPPGAPRPNPRASYYRYTTLYAKILYSKGDTANAWRYISEAYDSSNKKDAAINAQYAQLLMARQQYETALPFLEAAFRKGEATADMKAQLKQVYTKLHATATGYGQYADSLLQGVRANAQKEAQVKMISEPAFPFVLKNLAGKPVELAKLKGKVVVLDFWATWCGPCKKSFPAMQMAVNRYKDDKEVQFLFIDTWEHTDNPAPEVAAFIKENKYSFEVLLDGKDKLTNTNKVVTGYKVSGIPAKFIIDKNGNIRFKLTGFSGGDDAAVEELSAMIELAKKNKAD